MGFMRWSWQLGRVAGIDLFLHPTFLVLLAFVGLTQRDGLGAVLLTTAVFGCVLLHELGHALMARQFGIGTADITLYPIGGVARLERMPRAAGAELLIALAGPAVNIVLALGLWGLRGLAGLVGGSSGASEPLLALLDDYAITLTLINLGLAVFNLVPAFPMDGGRVLRALLSGWLGRMRATEVAANVGQILAMVFGTYSLIHGAWLQVFLAAFIFFAARTELWQVRAEQYRRRRMAPHAGGGVWIAPPGYRWVSRGHGVWQLAPIIVVAGDRDPIRWL
jgi:Zn-dependent protease